VGQKVLSKPSADSFAVGRRQKELKSFLHSLTIYATKSHLVIRCNGRKSVMVQK
jgi:hypothetical protein